ncbi:hypothetical protein BUALT_Bualt15G0067500 [Buddleja alternifolia]|uniref:7-deoxyloganetin glucosyltransferase n=1 Tax=Buddleja alternifolia TaxID=168488 RepID=A0AAV6WF02_9LAMI|nr:hypothetical protein BUALT_Bualt15G0067500 [Buddleja alternifolia]
MKCSPYVEAKRNAPEVDLILITKICMAACIGISIISMNIAISCMAISITCMAIAIICMVVAFQFHSGEEINNFEKLPMEHNQETRKPHAVCLPFPAQGHINPMMKLALLLHHYKNFHITFINTEYNHNRLLKSATVQDSSNFQFKTIPDGLPPAEDGGGTQDIPSLCFSTRKNCLEPLTEVINKLNHHNQIRRRRQRKLAFPVLSSGLQVRAASCAINTLFILWTKALYPSKSHTISIFPPENSVAVQFRRRNLQFLRMGPNQETRKPHAVCLPFPAQGHINPMMKLALLLHHYKNFHITFINTEYNHNRLLKSAAVQDSPDFQFKTIPDGLPPAEDGGGTQDIPSLCLSTRKNCLEPLTEVINKLNHHTSNSPPVSCLIVDSIMTFGLRAAEEIGVPGVLLRTASACSCMCYKHVIHLVEKGLVPLKDEGCLTNGYLDTPINWVPGMIPLRLKDFPNFIRTTDPNNPLLNFLITEVAQSSKASAIIINTFDALEHNVLNALSSISPPIFTVGPLHLFANQITQNTSKRVRSNLWKEDPECLKWLDSKQPNSVIYVNFGSIAVLSSRQLTEFAWGIAQSKKNFLWVVRPDLVQGENAALGPDYWEETGDRGLVVGWCPQEEVLSHPAVGGFLTHCGWNSINESLASGVPMLCWPFFADQHVNCRYACEEWGVGMEINSDVKRDEVGFLVRELLDGGRGKMMKKRAMEWKEKAGKAISSDGSSYLNLDRLVNEVLIG